jgi:hypothetical protein
VLESLSLNQCTNSVQSAAILSLLVRAESTSELRVDHATAALRRASTGRATVVTGTGSTPAKDRLRFTDSVLKPRQSSVRD